MKWFKKGLFRNNPKQKEIRSVEITGSEEVSDSMFKSPETSVEELLEHIQRQQKELDEKEREIKVFKYRLSYLTSVIEQMNDWKHKAS